MRNHAKLLRSSLLAERPIGSHGRGRREHGRIFEPYLTTIVTHDTRLFAFPFSQVGCGGIWELLEESRSLRLCKGRCPRKSKLLHSFPQGFRPYHYSTKAESYGRWANRFIFFRSVRHPAEMDEGDARRPHLSEGCCSFGSPERRQVKAGVEARRADYSRTHNGFVIIRARPQGRENDRDLYPWLNGVEEECGARWMRIDLGVVEQDKSMDGPDALCRKGERVRTRYCLGTLGTQMTVGGRHRSVRPP
jgi:hypothetical protein